MIFQNTDEMHREMGEGQDDTSCRRTLGVMNWLCGGGQEECSS